MYVCLCVYVLMCQERSYLFILFYFPISFLFFVSFFVYFFGLFCCCFSFVLCLYSVSFLCVLVYSSLYFIFLYTSRAGMTTLQENSISGKPCNSNLLIIFIRIAQIHFIFFKLSYRQGKRESFLLYNTFDVRWHCVDITFVNVITVTKICK